MSKSTQPVHIVLSRSGNINPENHFFVQQVPHWLITTRNGAVFWQNRHEFQEILVFETETAEIDLEAAFKHLLELGIESLAILGGGTLIASMLDLDLIDELRLTVCPLLLGGVTAPTPVEGGGFLAQLAPKLELLEVETVEQEVFLHYCIRRSD